MNPMCENIVKVLSSFADGGSLHECAKKLFETLGYSSARTGEINNVDHFIQLLEKKKKLTDRQRALLVDWWLSAEIVFQFTGDEIKKEKKLLNALEIERIESFLFVAVELKPNDYSRTKLADMTRVVNRGFAMPVIILFRNDDSLTLAAVHRRPNKLDSSSDVLEHVSLVKNIRIDKPHRAHISILADIALPNLVRKGAKDFDNLHSLWEKVLDISNLNQRFYNDLFKWFEKAIEQCHFPDDGAREGSAERHVIRLIMRLLFIWFLKEKNLVPEELFEESFANKALKHHAPENTDYYRAVLQNLFFATLNTEINKRAFDKEAKGCCHDFGKYRYRDLLSKPKDFVSLLRIIPFVNGGLFDCLDDFTSTGKSGQLVDVFTDNPPTDQKLVVPARLFFDHSDGLFPLLNRYKFTVEENTPIDREVALDPELLGRVFENLLAAYNPETRETARKATGSYYTPRKVVDYMVDEAIVAALSGMAQSDDDRDETGWHKKLHHLLDHGYAFDDGGKLFADKDESNKVVRIISRIRILDPAVGSGAFPMGILQKLTLALRRLDPDNSQWEELQRELAIEHAKAAFAIDDLHEREVILREISNTFERYRKSDFGRKLYLIQNSIYGVDIQPIACQLAKLRFFISLVIEQQRTDDDADNYGIKPLPNLETRFVAADILISPDITKQGTLGEEKIEDIENRLHKVRQQYFNARTRETKLELQKKDDALRIELASTLEGLDFGHDYSEAIAKWNPYNQNAQAEWFDPKSMFGSNDFDVVIGNPPYIQLQKNSGRLGKRYRDKKFETFASTGDIYQLFYERGCRLLKPGEGTLAYITSNSWLKAEYGRSLRRWFAERHTPLSLIEMGKDVFNAIVDTAVLIVRNGKGEPVTCRAVDVEQASDDRFPPPKGDWGTLQPESERPWMALSSIERAVMEKMETAGTPLKDWDISIYRGIVTGYNDAFIVDTASRNRLIAEDPKSEEVLKPVLRGRDIARYRANWAGFWLIDTHNGYQGVPRSTLMTIRRSRLI